MVTKFRRKKDYITEDVTVKLNRPQDNKDFVIYDVTVLNDINNGDVQAPDIDGLLQLAEQSLQEKYGSSAISINRLSTVNKLNENYQYSIVDVQTKEVKKHLQEKGIKDACIGNIYLIESTKSGLQKFKVNSLAGTTKYSKVTSNLKEEITKYIETEFLHDASIEYENKLLQERNAELKRLTEIYLGLHPEIKSKILFVKSQIDVFKKAKQFDEIKDSIIAEIYAIALGFPMSTEVTDGEKKSELKFENVDEVVEILFGKDYVRKEEKLKESALPNISKFIYDLDVDKGNSWSVSSYTEDGNGNKIIIVDKNGRTENTAKDIKNAVEEKYKNLKGEITENGMHIWFYLKENTSLKESYQTFQIGDIEGTFNNQTLEVVYSIPTKEVSDKKLNLSDVADTDQPYDTETIIKNYIVNNLVSPDEVNAQQEPQEDEVEQGEANIKEDGDDDIAIDMTDEETVGNGEQENDEETQEAQQETGSAVFFKTKQSSPVSLEDLRQKALNGVSSQQSSYIVVEEKILSDEDWENWTNDLSQSEDFLAGVKAIDRKNYAFNVVKVSTQSQQYSLLVDTVGYDYARYIAILDN